MSSHNDLVNIYIVKWPSRGIILAKGFISTRSKTAFVQHEENGKIRTRRFKKGEYAFDLELAYYLIKKKAEKYIVYLDEIRYKHQNIIDNIENMEILKQEDAFRN